MLLRKYFCLQNLFLFYSHIFLKMNPIFPLLGAFWVVKSAKLLCWYDLSFILGVSQMKSKKGVLIVDVTQ